MFSTAIGIRCKDGVVFGVEKLVLSKLYEEGSNKRIFNIDRHIGMVTTQAVKNISGLFSVLHKCVYRCAKKTVLMLIFVFLFFFLDSVKSDIAS